jgi:TonB family protein
MEETEKTAIAAAPVSAGMTISFPDELRFNIIQELDKKLLLILGIVGVIFLAVAVILSSMDVPELSQEDMIKMQERFAKLVLNKELSKEEKKEEMVQEKVGKTEKKKEEKKEKIDRKEETVQEKRERKKATKEQRTKKIAAAREKVASMGIFAQLTSSSDFGGSSNVKDLIGGSSTTGLDNIDLSSGSFVTKKEEVGGTRERRGTKATAGSIEKVAVKKATSQKMTTVGTVKATKVEKIEGEAASHANRSYDAINKIMRRTKRRIIRDFERLLKRNPKISGKISIKFTILPSGTVSNVKIIKSTVNSTELERSVTKWIKRARFPKIADSEGELEVVFPFVFTVSEG